MKKARKAAQGQGKARQNQHLTFHSIPLCPVLSSPFHLTSLHFARLHQSEGIPICTPPRLLYSITYPFLNCRPTNTYQTYRNQSIPKPSFSMRARTATTILTAATTIAAQSVVVIIEASHGGAGVTLTNTSITVPLSDYYTNPALDAVSTLYLTQASGVNLTAVTCTPYRYAEASDNAGLPFNSTTPSFISTNTRQIGSVFCNATTTTSGKPPPQTPIYSNTTTSAHSAIPTAHNVTSVFVTTVPASAKPSPSTFTSVETFSGPNGPTTSTYTAVVNVPAQTTTAAPSLNSEGAAAPVRRVGTWMAGAVAGLGLMVAL